MIDNQMANDRDMERGERSAKLRDSAYDSLFDDLRSGFGNPQRLIYMPGLTPKKAVDVIFGDMTDEEQHVLLKIVFDAARGAPAHMRFAEWIDRMCRRHAEFYADDLVALMEDAK